VLKAFKKMMKMNQQNNKIMRIMSKIRKFYMKFFRMILKMNLNLLLKAKYIKAQKINSIIRIKEKVRAIKTTLSNTHIKMK
jgi:hypothetical protein